MNSESVKRNTGNDTVEVFHARHKTNPAAPSCTDLESVDTHSEVAPSVVLEYVCVLRRLLKLVVHCDENSRISIRDLDTEVNKVVARGCPINQKGKRISACC